MNAEQQSDSTSPAHETKVPHENRPYARIPVVRGPDLVEVLLDCQVFAYLIENRFSIGFERESKYPQVYERNGARLAELHFCVVSYYAEEVKGLYRLPRRDEHIHHVEHNVLDARISHLVLRAGHKHLADHAIARQKFGRRKRGKANIHNPKAPGPVYHLIDRVGQERSPIVAPQKSSYTEVDIEAEYRLALMLPELRKRLRHLESRRRIPCAEKADWYGFETRSLGLKPTPLGLWPGEAAVVYALVENKFDRGATAASLSISVVLLERIMARVRVQVAIERWQRYRRFPTPCPKNRPYEIRSFIAARNTTPSTGTKAAGGGR